MSDQPDEQDGTVDEVTEPAADQPLAAWPEAADGPAWSEIEDQPESAAPGPAGPGASPEAHAEVEPEAAGESEPEATGEPEPEPTGESEPEATGEPEPEAGNEPEPELPTEVQPATEAGRSRRPTSLRDQYVQSDESVPWRSLSAPAFPSAPGIPGSAVPSPVSESAQPGTPGQMDKPDPAPAAHVHDHEPGPSLKQRLDKLPLDKLPLDKLSLSKLPLDKLSRDKLPTGKLSTDKLSTDKLPVEKLRAITKQRPEVGLGLAFAGGLVIATILKRLGRR